MKARSKYDPFDNFVVTESVRSLPGFDLRKLEEALADILDGDMGISAFSTNKSLHFGLFGACLLVAFDDDELLYDLGASDPSSPFCVLTVMLASEAGGGAF